MEISLLKMLLNQISLFSNLSSCDCINSECVLKYYQKAEDILKLLKPVLHALFGSEIASDEVFKNAFEELGHSIEELRELLKSWKPLASKVYLVLQSDSLISKIRRSTLDIFQLLQCSHEYLSSEFSSTLEHCVQKIKHMGHEETPTIMKDALRNQLEGVEPCSDILVKIADSLGLRSNQEILIEAVSLEKLKENAEQVERNEEAEYIDQMVALVNCMHDHLIVAKQSQSHNQVPIPSDFCCPLSLELMTDPVIVASGQTYERSFIKRWIDLGLTICPKTRQTLSHTNLIPNYTVKGLIANWCELHKVMLTDPIKSVNLTRPSALLGSRQSDGNTKFPGKNLNSQCENHKPLLRRSQMEDSLPSSAGNSLGSDIARLSPRHSENTLPGQINLSPSRTNNGSEQPSNHSRTSSASSPVSTSPKVMSSDLSGDAESGSQREQDFPARLLDLRARNHTLRRRPSDRFRQRMVSSSTPTEMRPDLSELEAQVQKLIQDLNNPSPDTVKAATAELRLLAKHNMDNRIVIANCGAITILVNLLHSQDPKIQENAVTALLNLSINDNNKTAIAQADAIEPLIHVLETGTPEAKENSAATLFSLSVIEDNKVRIGRSGAIIPLVDLLGNGTPRGKKDAATALFNLSIFHENKARVVQAGAVRHLVELMDPAAGMVDKAVAVLSNLATILEGRNAIGQEGGIPVLVEVVELGSARGKENAAAALLHLCTNSSRFCNMVLQEGAVPPLVALSQSGTPRAKEKAQALLSYFRNHRHGNAGRG